MKTAKPKVLTTSISAAMLAMAHAMAEKVKSDKLLARRHDIGPGRPRAWWKQGSAHNKYTPHQGGQERRHRLAQKVNGVPLYLTFTIPELKAKLARTVKTGGRRAGKTTAAA